MTTAVITATAAPDTTARITITVTGADPGETMSIYRIDGEARTAVLGAVNIPAVSTVITDAAVPLNRAVRWVVVFEADPEVVTIVPATVPSVFPLLSDPYTAEVVTVQVVEVDDELALRSRAEVLTVEGDVQPYVVGDRPTGYYGRLSLLTITAEDAAALFELAAVGKAMLLRCSCGLHGDRWIRVTEDLITARLVKKPALEARLHSWDGCIYLPRAPFPNRLTVADTLQELHDAVPTTLADIATSWATLGEIAATDLSEGL